MSSPWKKTEPPKDGTLIIAIGSVIYEFSAGDEDDFGVDAGPAIGACSDPFVAEVRWMAEPNQAAGWHYLSGLSVARTLEDLVKIDFWLEAPRSEFDQYLKSTIPQLPRLSDRDLEVLAENALKIFMNEPQTVPPPAQGVARCVCAYCKTEYGKKPVPLADDGMVTHGICPPCEMLADA
jgi:hypothetical protein